MRPVVEIIKDRRKLIVLLPGLALIACLVGIYVTRDSMANLQFRRATSGSSDLVDQRPWTTAQTLAALAVSAEEQRHAREAERIADHEVDQAFATALRQASLSTPVLSGHALELSHKIQTLQQIVKDDQAQVDQLTQEVKGPNGVTLTDDLDVAKAQLALDNDVLTDAAENLAMQGGDQRNQIQQELAAHEAAMKSYDERVASGGQIAVVSARRYGTLYGRLNAWFDQRNRYASVIQAQQQADADAEALTKQYGQLRAEINAAQTPGSATRNTAMQSQQVQGAEVQIRVAPAPNVTAFTKAAKLAQIKRLSTQSNILGILGDRMQSMQQLSIVYGKWAAQIQLQHRIVGHLVLQSLAWIATILLCAGVISSIIHAVLERPKMDHRRMHTLRTILILATQVVALLMILLVFFGPPNQVPTILGLATAGLTVAFQDFILAFFGWFVLMGKNGIRIDDWVEINGVGGEVVDIGLFRTSLLETGNWTDKGHPTGRRVTFLNKFAISGQYFNFSTNGQWMWDEITVNIPTAENSYETIELIHKAVLKETEKDASLAEHEWQRVTKQSNLSQFSAAPAVDMRPAANGIDIVVRYVTRASGRFEMRNRLYQSVINLMRGQPTAPMPTFPDAPSQGVVKQS
jgi:small-conductance mechanosensitive channel